MSPEHLRAFLIFPMRVTRSTHFILFDFTFSEGSNYEAARVVSLQPANIFSLLHSHIDLSLMVRLCLQALRFALLFPLNP
jgi:hypothetical protein